MKIATIALAAAVLPLWAQEIKFPVNLDRLAEKAEAAVVVTLDKSMLKLTSRFLDKDDDAAEVKKLIANLDGIYVRSFTFASDGQYSPADLQAVRDQLQAPAWGRIVGVRSKRHGDDVDVFFKDAGNGQLGGIVVIAAEARELTIVDIVGTFDPARLADLSGEFGIPKLEGRSIRREWQ